MHTRQVAEYISVRVVEQRRDRQVLSELSAALIFSAKQPKFCFPHSGCGKLVVSLTFDLVNAQRGVDWQTNVAKHPPSDHAPPCYWK